ncbi:MAG: hypothetical protein LBV38_04880 [Alistipes sp.]|jgi:hypothetical protein|nr:hypothetical protein [Alistipes sp.]
MKKRVLALAALILATSTASVASATNIANVTDVTDAAADEKSEALLSELQRKVAGWGDYRVEFSVTIGDEALGGSFEVSGESYHVVTPEVELFCDGTTRHEVNTTDREVSIDRVDPLDRSVMANPTRLFDLLDGSYTHRYVGVALINGVSCERVELRSIENADNGASDGSGAPRTMDVFISTATGMPVRIGYVIGFMGAEAAVDIVRVTPNITLYREAFVYNARRFAGFETIDFR